MKVFFGQNENKNRKISKSKNTKPELKVRAHLRYNKVSYRIHDKMLPGTPDIIIPRYKIAINIFGYICGGVLCIDWGLTTKCSDLI